MKARRYLITLLIFIFSLKNMDAKPKVYDCFAFFNELEVLDMRLHELDDVVDKFVLIEAVETFRGNPKPLYFLENKERYAKFAHKIIHLIKYDLNPVPDAWQRDYAQKNALLRGLTHCDEDDIIIISDCDEIIRKEDIPVVVEAIASGQYEYVGADLTPHTNFLNSYNNGTTMRGPVITTYKNVRDFLPQGVRQKMHHVPALATGWHFSWQGGIDLVLYKMGAYAHSEDDTPENREKTKRDYENRYSVPVVPIDDHFPQYMIDNQDRLEELGFIYRPWLYE